MILDTNAVSALAIKNRPLIHRLEGTNTLAVTFVTIGEFVYGLRGSKARVELEQWLKGQFLERTEILFPDPSTLEHYADVRYELKMSGTPIPANDIWIAALVRQYAMPLLSLDKHFDYVKGVVRIGW